jgi:hypothetical protein
MGPRAQVNEIAALISCNFHVISNLCGQQLDLERIVLKQLKSLLLRQDQALEILLLLNNFLSASLNCHVIFIGDVLPRFNKKCAIYLHLFQSMNRRRSQPQ